MTPIEGGRTSRPMATALPLHYAVRSSPLGPVTVVESERGVVRIDFGAPSPEALARELARGLGRPVALEKRARLRSSTELAEYFRRRRHTFGVEVDYALATPFQKRVLGELARVGFGELVTYGELAARIGKPKASRAVGIAMAKNPIPIILPCHRVVAADGSLGGFSGGLELKRRLHAHEGIAPLAGGWEPSRSRRR